MTDHPIEALASTEADEGTLLDRVRGHMEHMRRRDDNRDRGTWRGVREIAGQMQEPVAAVRKALEKLANHGLVERGNFSNGIAWRGTAPDATRIRSALVPKGAGSGGRWTPWAGGECPVPKGTRGVVRVEDGEEVESSDIAGFGWGHDGGFETPVTGRRIVAYRIDSAIAPVASVGVTVSDEMVERAREIYVARIAEYDRDFWRDGFGGEEWTKKYGTNLHSTSLGEEWAMRAALTAALTSLSSGEEGKGDA